MILSARLHAQIVINQRMWRIAAQLSYKPSPVPFNFGPSSKRPEDPGTATNIHPVIAQ